MRAAAASSHARLCTYSSSASASWALAMRAAATSGETRFFLMPLSLVTSRGLAWLSVQLCEV